MSKTTDPSFRDRWARVRFSIIGHLLAAPPEAGELHRELAALAAKTWRHPATGLPVRVGFSTLERWFYAVRASGRPAFWGSQSAGVCATEERWRTVPHER